MTHDKSAAAVIGAGATIMLIADLLYSGSHWSGSFPRSFVIALLGLAAGATASFLLRLNRPLGTSRTAARRRQRGSNGVLIAVLVAVLGINDEFGGNSAGEMLGALAGLAAGFVIFTLVWGVRKRA